MKEKIVQSTIILLIGGFITKLLSLGIRINMTRQISPEGMGLYMMVLPTFNLLISIGQIGLPNALSKLIAEDKRNNKKLFLSILPIASIFNLLLMIGTIIIAPFISENLLHNKETYLCLVSMAFVIPFTTASSLSRSYFFGKERMIPHVTSNILENITRLGMIMIGIPHILPYGITITIVYIILSNIISELVSTIVLLIFLPKNIRINTSDLKPNTKYIKESLNIGIPNTMNRIIGSIGYFLEPILLTYFLLRNGNTSHYITTEYGILSGYVIPLVLLPSFFTLAISQAILPSISKDYASNNQKRIKNSIQKSLIFSGLIGIPFTLLFSIKPSECIQIIYHTTKGANYLRIISPFFLLQYIESPLVSTLEAMGKSKENLKIAIISTITRMLSLILFSQLNIGIYCLILTFIMNHIITSILLIKKVRKILLHWH